MDGINYNFQLERKLIDQFKQSFFEKIGYYPTVITKVHALPKLSLNTLESHFTQFLPVRYQRTVKLKSKHRYREIVELRMIYCTLARQMGYSFIEIGKYLDNKDHTTIMHNIKSFKNLMQTCNVFRNKYNTIFNYIKNYYNHESSTMDNIDQVQHQSESVILP